ncbi:MAG TPA: iron-containing alcohol dehydrogenase [Candidatus Hydrogenedentes bacterium]|nr:iron-containing alcohol dehydrogenase [Candidatus Hydrogenedentota bacterium]HPG69049.1 iron-containing alcohol dehydrogenase [Candidatus Hydrogenedentota bacterium]
MTHKLPIEACHTGTDAADRMADFARARCGTTCLVISDENTRAAAGDRPVAALTNVGKHVSEKVYPGEPFEATEELAKTVAELGAGVDFFVAIGTGTLCDLAKYAGDKLGRPVLLYPTAASMNGYTSAIVALKVRGLKRTQPCKPALGVFSDPEVVATAPQRMTAAGVGDFLSKASSSADWRASNILRGCYYCPRPTEFSEDIQKKILAAGPRIRANEPEAISLVLDGLLLTGFGMVVAGSSAPASGGEHLISHYLDMKHALYHTENDLHGAQVGVGTIYALGLWEKVLALDPESLDPEALASSHPSEDAIRVWIEEDWGPVAPEVLVQWREKSLDRQALKAEIERFIEKQWEMRELLSRDLLPSAQVAQLIQDAGGAITAEGLTVPIEEYRKAERFARYLRNRFTILDLAAELGVV